MIYYRIIDEAIPSTALHDMAHTFFAELLKRNYGIEKFRLEKGEHGKPFLPDYPNIHFNLSHCRGLLLCGFSDSEIGVDAEQIRPYNGRAAKRIFSDEELELVQKSTVPDEMFFRIWTLKEALGKNLGTGLSSAMSEFSFALDYDEPCCKAYPQKKFVQKIIQKKWVVSICADNPCFINRNAFCP
ncbi:MAG: 4'-phosphopantetheinyl transferase superfamily protein [Oscillospiraceae bacterium]|nr:4'-phosphopantetheinyl transferase superfamily protein [Oscillospiraceae bacterium]